MNISTNKRRLNLANIIEYKIKELDIYQDSIFVVESDIKTKNSTEYQNKLALCGINDDLHNFIVNLIESNFEDSLINDEKVSYEEIEKVISRNYQEVISYSSDYFTVKFHGNTINIYSDIIDQLAQRRIEDQYRYAKSKIVSGSIRNLCLKLNPDISTEIINGTRLIKNTKHILNYQLAYSYSGNKDDIDNFIKIMNGFYNIKSKTSYFSKKDGNKVSFLFKGYDIMEVEGYSYSKEVEDKVLKMIKRGI